MQHLKLEKILHMLPVCAGRTAVAEKPALCGCRENSYNAGATPDPWTMCFAGLMDRVPREISGYLRTGVIGPGWNGTLMPAETMYHGLD